MKGEKRTNSKFRNLAGESGTKNLMKRLLTLACDSDPDTSLEALEVIGSSFGVTFDFNTKETSESPSIDFNERFVDSICHRRKQATTRYIRDKGGEPNLSSLKVGDVCQATTENGQRTFAFVEINKIETRTLAELDDALAVDAEDLSSADELRSVLRGFYPSIEDTDLVRVIHFTLVDDTIVSGLIPVTSHSRWRHRCSALRIITQISKYLISGSVNINIGMRCAFDQNANVRCAAIEQLEMEYNKSLDPLPLAALFFLASDTSENVKRAAVEIILKIVKSDAHEGKKQLLQKVIYSSMKQDGLLIRCLQGVLYVAKESEMVHQFVQSKESAEILMKSTEMIVNYEDDDEESTLLFIFWGEAMPITLFVDLITSRRRNTSSLIALVLFWKGILKKEVENEVYCKIVQLGMERAMEAFHFESFSNGDEKDNDEVDNDMDGAKCELWLYFVKICLLERDNSKLGKKLLTNICSFISILCTKQIRSDYVDGDIEQFYIDCHYEKCKKIAKEIFNFFIFKKNSEKLISSVIDNLLAWLSNIRLTGDKKTKNRMFSSRPYPTIHEQLISHAIIDVMIPIGTSTSLCSNAERLSKLLPECYRKIDTVDQTEQFIGLQGLSHLMKTMTSTEIQWHGALIPETVMRCLASRDETILPMVVDLLIYAVHVMEGTKSDHYEFHHRVMSRFVQDLGLLQSGVKGATLRISYIDGISNLIKTMKNESVFYWRELLPLLSDIAIEPLPGVEFKGKGKLIPVESRLGVNLEGTKIMRKVKCAALNALITIVQCCHERIRTSKKHKKRILACAVATYYSTPINFTKERRLGLGLGSELKKRNEEFVKNSLLDAGLNEMWEKVR
eukprot:g211.t1